ncbi:hypothetical protein JXA88_16225 [Candidatus Fermentibacteria bacterium]|nr:hypothetical protein [Candidatus Fermentibacteria bacterium]
MRWVALACILLAGFSSARAGDSRAVAAVLSAVVPGVGQAYLGWRGSAEAFVIAEGMVWGGRLYFVRRASGSRDAYIAYAATHAGSDASIREETYYDDIDRYWNSERANQHYQDPERYTGSKVWHWHTVTERREFSALVRDRRQWDSSAKNVLALAVFTRAASVIHCLKAGAGQKPVELISTPTEVGLSVRW